MVGQSQPIEGSLASPPVCQASHDLQRSILVRWLLAGGASSPFGWGQPPGFVIFWHKVSAAVKGIRGRPSSRSDVLYGELSPPGPCSCGATSTFQVIKWIGFSSHYEHQLGHPCSELLAGPIASFAARPVLWGAPALVPTLCGGD